MPIDTDLAWAAGLFEGEGYLTRKEQGARIYLGFGIEMRDLDVITRFVQILRANGVTMSDRASGPKTDSRIRIRKRAQRNPKHSDIYIWTTTGSTAEHAYRLLRPYLGERRRARGDGILAEVRDRLSQLPTHGICSECGQPFPFTAYGRTRLFCSKLCYSRAKIRRPGQREAARERSRHYEQRQRVAVKQARLDI